MSTTQIRVVGAAVLFLLIFLSGFVLSRGGKPYSVLLFNLHKLIALGAVVYLGLTVSRIHQAAPLGPGQLAAVVVTGLCFVATIVTGGLVSIDKPMPAALSSIHHLLPYATLLSTAGALYLLLAAQNELSIL
jgi:hypothetical protein